MPHTAGDRSLRPEWAAWLALTVIFCYFCITGVLFDPVLSVSLVTA
jgi:hypothetical protein